MRRARKRENGRARVQGAEMSKKANSRKTAAKKAPATKITAKEAAQSGRRRRGRAPSSSLRRVPEGRTGWRRRTPTAARTLLPSARSGSTARSTSRAVPGLVRVGTLQRTPTASSRSRSPVSTSSSRAAQSASPIGRRSCVLPSDTRRRAGPRASVAGPHCRIQRAERRTGRRGISTQSADHGR